MKRFILVILGLLCLVLAGLGFLLPGLPGTPFVLLAAACFAKSSPRLHDWLLANRFFGPIISNWRQSRSIPRRTKQLAIGMVVGAAAISLYSLNSLALRLVLLAVLTIPLCILLRLKETESLLVEVEEAESSDDHLP
ncbi:MAG: hypothetical protein C0613_06285 [Desulfobulbaceae bacterium]|nr:MAG: hypothetical protein C0613_06285 [Desulfobulbaceae bacterium]